MESDPPWSGIAPVAIFGEAAEPIPIPQFLNDNSGRIRTVTADWIFDRMRNSGKGIAVLAGTVESAITIEPQGWFITGDDGRRARLVRLTVFTETSVSFDDVEVRRQLYGPVGVTSGLIDVPEMGCSFKVSAIQAPGKNVAGAIVANLPFEKNRPQ